MIRSKLVLCTIAFGLSACAATDGASMDRAEAASAWSEVARAKPAAHHPARVAKVVSGQASWYGRKFHGRTTASGEPFDMNGMTAAHRTLPFGTRIRVVNPANGRSVVVRVNDRGPFSGHRIIDLSRGAAERIGLRSQGVGPVKLEVLARS